MRSIFTATKNYSICGDVENFHSHARKFERMVNIKTSVIEKMLTNDVDDCEDKLPPYFASDSEIN